MKNILKEVEKFYHIVLLERFRKTEGVSFEYLSPSAIPRISSIDRVIHDPGARSPGSIAGVDYPWYMHPHQDDNLIVLHGRREVDIFTPEYGKVEHFTVTPDSVSQGGELLHTGPAMLVWPRGVFHRIESGKEGSASINLATHYRGFDLRTNFNIYDLDIKTGKSRVIREGARDQF